LDATGGRARPTLLPNERATCSEAASSMKVARRKVTQREWDIKVVWIERRQKWWWNAWQESTSTELWGFAESRELAVTALTAAVENHRSMVLQFEPKGAHPRTIPIQWDRQ
jgi:hypothetical protein